MTAHNPPSDQPHNHTNDCVGDCVGTASETTLRGTAEMTASVGPSPYGTDAVSEPPTTASATTASTASDTPHGQTGTNWLITDRTRAFWTAVLDLLNDRRAHQITELIDLGFVHGLTQRTVENLIPRASKRRWITKKHDRVALLDANALRQALAADRSPRVRVSEVVREYAVRSRTGQVIHDPSWRCEADVIHAVHGLGVRVAQGELLERTRIRFVDDVTGWVGVQR